jgi:hypothetical protein
MEFTTRTGGSSPISGPAGLAQYPLHVIHTLLSTGEHPVFGRRPAGPGKASTFSGGGERKNRASVSMAVFYAKYAYAINPRGSSSHAFLPTHIEEQRCIKRGLPGYPVLEGTKCTLGSPITARILHVNAAMLLVYQC